MVNIGASAGMMAGLKAAAASGAFEVNEAGGQALLSAIRDMATWVDNNRLRLASLAREQPLGSSNGANAMKPYLLDVATDNQGFFTQLTEFRASLVDAEQAILDAMKNYDNTEHSIQGNFRVI
jgi:hypothetical protein